MAPAIAKTHIATSAIATATQPRCSSVRPRKVLGLPRVLSAPRGRRAGTVGVSFPARFSGAEVSAASGGARVGGVEAEVASRRAADTETSSRETGSLTPGEPSGATARALPDPEDVDAAMAELERLHAELDAEDAQPLDQ